MIEVPDSKLEMACSAEEMAILHRVHGYNDNLVLLFETEY